MTVDRIVSYLLFGKKLGTPEKRLGRSTAECSVIVDWVLRPGGRAVLLVGDPAKLYAAAHAVGWKS